MSLPVLLAVLAAALLHAGWNALIKTGGDKQTGMLMLTLGNAAIGAVVVALRPLPIPEAWPWIVGSALIHTTYQLFLAYAYEHGDLSRVYPIARGTAPLIVTIVGAFALADAVTATEYFGIFVLGLGIMTMARGVFSSGESRRMLPFALGAAVTTAGYSLVDGTGARVSGDAFAYVGWLLILAAVFYVPLILVLRGRRVLRATPRGWGLGLVAAAASYIAYAVVVWAMTQAPIALVTALRETSILFAVLIGWALFGEKMNRGKLLAAGLVVSGVVLTRL
jgi:drug/metabolite transporter (DMT)-like permease